MVVQPDKLPEWASSGVGITEPTEGKKDLGWSTAGGSPEKPPYQFFNWWMEKVYRWIEWMILPEFLSSYKRRSNGLVDYSPKTYGKHFDTGVSIGSLVDAPGMAFCPINNTMYVLDQPNGNVNPVNVIDNTVGSGISVGTGASITWAIAYCPINNTMYVTNGADDNVVPIDCGTNTAGTPISVGSAPYSIAYCPTNNTMYVTNSADNDITPIDCSTDTAGTDIAVGDTPLSVAYCPANNKMYVANAIDGTLIPIDCDTNIAETPINIVDTSGDYPFCVSYSYTNNRLYIAVGIVATSLIDIKVFDCSTELITDTINLPANNNVNGYDSLVYNPSNNYLYFVDDVNDEIYAINCEDNSISSTVISSISDLMGSIAYCPFNNTMFVPSSGTNSVYLLGSL